MVPLVIIRDAFLPETAVILSGVILSHDPDHLIPIFFPFLMVEAEDLLQGVELGHLQIPVDLFQGIVDPGAHERLNAFRLDLNFVNISELVLVGTGFIG
jgi:hypothetical protein